MVKQVVVPFYIFVVLLVSVFSQADESPKKDPRVASREGSQLRADTLEQLSWLQNVLAMHSIDPEEMKPFIKWRNGRDSYFPNEAAAPWAGNYFAMAARGIARRWQERTFPEIFDPIRPLFPVQFQKPMFKKIGKWSIPKRRQYFQDMKTRKINKLSPVEKLDLAMGRYGFDATEIEYKRRGTLREPLPLYWEGFCNGARAAGVCLPEPTEPVTVINPDGISITFEPADLKALGSAMYFYVEKFAALGEPTKKEEEDSSNMPNPVAVDVSLRFVMGKHQKPFFFDKSPSEKILNRTIVGYDRRILDQRPDRSLKKLHKDAVGYIDYEVIVYALGEVSISRSNGSTKEWVTNRDNLEKNIWRYRLIYDQTDNILMGQWLDGKAPDYVWFAGGQGIDATHLYGVNKYLNFKDIYSLVYRASLPHEIGACESLFLDMGTNF